MYRQIEFITLNVATFVWIIASIADYLPIMVGVIVGLSIAGLNLVRIITEIRKWKEKKKKEASN